MLGKGKCVLFREVSVIQGCLFRERFHCIWKILNRPETKLTEGESLEEAHCLTLYIASFFGGGEGG